VTQKDRAFFTQTQIDEVYIGQGGGCAGDGCTNSLASGFQAHHKNKKHQDNRTENLALLCVPCHTKTLTDDPLKNHNKLVETLMKYRESAIVATLKNEIKGTDLERLLAGIEQQKSDSWKLNGLSNMFLYPSAEITMKNVLVKNGQLEEVAIKSFVAGMRSVRAEITMELEKK